MPATATVRVSRHFAGQSAYDKHDAVLSVDGEVKGTVAPQGETTIALPPGRHTIILKLKYNWFKTSFEVELAAGSTTAVVFERTVASARGLFSKSAYWTARVNP